MFLEEYCCTSDQENLNAGQRLKIETWLIHLTCNSWNHAAKETLYLLIILELQPWPT